MRRAPAALVTAAWLGVAGTAAAQVEPPAEAPAQAPRRPPRREPPNIFISPSGEPFHGAAEAPYAAADWFRRADADGDGRLTRAEFLADADRFFRQLDTDGDGVIDGFEIRAYEDRVAPEILPRIGGLRANEGQDRNLFHDRNGGVGREGAHGERNSGEGSDQGRSGGRITAADTTFSGAGIYGVLNEPEPVQACDTDLDGRVSLAEWRAKAARRFTLLDAKGAGALALDTLPKTYVQTLREKAAAKRAKEAAAGRR